MLNTKQTQFVEHAYAMFNKKELTEIGGVV
jgi:hypothetical protein